MDSAIPPSHSLAAELGPVPDSASSSVEPLRQSPSHLRIRYNLGDTEKKVIRNHIALFMSVSECKLALSRREHGYLGHLVECPISETV